MSTPQNDSDESLVNNILPSYHMFQSTISKSLTSSQEDFTSDPPNYTPTPGQSMANSPFSSPPSTPGGEEFPFPVSFTNSGNENDQIEIWENTIIANIHRMTNLAKSNEKLMKDLDINIHITRKVCQKGVKPDVIDPLNLELHQGDYIHGYVTIENTSSQPINFDMVYVVFEGTLIVLENENGLIDTQTPKAVHKFLNMTDLFASWSFANINRLTTDHGDPHDWCVGDTDPYDNTQLSLDLKRQFQPHTKYKRFFTFKIPDKLLEDICDVHNLNGHTQIPSTLGYPKYYSKPSSLLSKKNDVNDLAFLDTSVAYNVACRVIGKSSDYRDQSKPIRRDQYVIANETICPIRVIPLPSPFYIQDNLEVLRYFNAFIRSVRDKIDLGNSILESRQALQDMSLSPVNSTSSTDFKLKQLFNTSTQKETKKSQQQRNYDVYQNIIPFKKKALLLQSKKVSLVSLSTPKYQYKVHYIPPLKYRHKPYNDPTVEIPVLLSYHDVNSKSIPEIKSVKAELISMTIRSPQYLIPVEINHELFLKDEELEMIAHNHDGEFFRDSVIKPCQSYLNQLTKLIDKVGGDAIRVERQLYHDLKALASLAVKASGFSVDEVSITPNCDINTIPWEKNLEEGMLNKSFKIHLNLSKCHSKAQTNLKNVPFFDTVTLVPDFQSCFMVRLYYIKLIVKLTNGESLIVKVPLNVERRE